MAWQLAAAAIGLGTSLLSAYGQMQAGKLQARAAEIDAYNKETEAIQNQALATQQANARREEYDLATSANIAQFAAMGRDIGSDKSVAAFLERQKEIVGKDIGRIGTQAQMENLGLRFAAAGDRFRGRAAYQASVYSAIGTIGQGLHSFASTMAGSGGSAPSSGGGTGYAPTRSVRPKARPV